MIFWSYRTEQHFKSRPGGEIYFPAKDRSGAGYLIEDEQTSQALRRKLVLIHRAGPVWIALCWLAAYLIYRAYPNFSVLALVLVALQVADLTGALLRRLIAWGLPRHQPAIVNPA